ncbi:MerR family transcriptional regulator [Actinomadura nitritigenes]|uniref:MerR family transcriptional regulator n=1 Tax=Actinomadura nitritigenes TaxID=134602 RepID=A0ABS3QTL3_9ACTN|nr:MerR family transcriptional regulator [Actinomadura nitritigenes]MBO2437266.1 MerR family transcriptional regulator [Actinomadura nitritigenes]
MTYLSIGDFSRATHMSVKTLRHYHRVGLLEPAHVDPATGYRRYTAEQIPTAQVIRRFRDLGMPLDDIDAVLAAPDVHARNERIVAHLHRLEDDLGRTRRAVAALRDLLAPPPADASANVELRGVPAVRAAAVTGVVDVADMAAWFEGALGELYGTLAAQGVQETGHAGGVFADEVYTRHRGEMTIFVPCAGTVRPMGRVVPHEVPAAELAVITHHGPPAEADRSYGLLAAYVSRHALAVDGPMREYYLVGRRDTPDSSRWRTEIGWPVFQTAPAPADPPAPPHPARTD